MSAAHQRIRLSSLHNTQFPLLLKLKAMIV